MSFRFSICHPTARVNSKDPLWWLHSAMAFHRRCDHPELVEYILVVHESNWAQYCNLVEGASGMFGSFKVVKNTGANRSLAQGRVALDASTGDIIIGSMDDLFPPEHWDTQILNAFLEEAGAGKGGYDNPKVLHVSSGSQGDYRTFIPQIFTRARQQQCPFPPSEYWSMYADCEFTELAVKDRVVIEAPHIQFEHKHFSLGTAQHDAVYAETNSKEAFEHDWGVFMRRRAAGFPKDVSAPARAHLGSHPMFEYRCDYHECWCHTPECRSRVERNGERCNCQPKGVMPSESLDETPRSSAVKTPAPEHRGGLSQEELKQLETGFRQQFDLEMRFDAEEKPVKRPLFSILHTSSRPEKWRNVFADWMMKANRPEDVEYILCCDARWGFTSRDTEDWVVSKDPRGNGRNVVVWNDTPYKYSGYVAGVNKAAESSTGQILIVVADDQFACEGWDEKLTRSIAQARDRFNDPGFFGSADYVVEVSTGTVNEHERGIFVMPIISRSRYEQLGYVFYPAYESMYADNDLCEHARKDGVVIDARHLVFPHRHPLIPVESGNTQAVDETEWDKSYRAQHSQGAYELGSFVLENRRANGFTDLRCSLCNRIFGTKHASTCERTGKVEILPRPTAPKGIIAWCLPFQQCSAGWYVASFTLYDHMRARGFDVRLFNAQSPVCFISREVIRKSVMEQCPDTNLLLWQDSDNPMTPAQFDMLVEDLESHPDLMLVGGWYRQTPGSNGEDLTAAAHVDNGEMKFIPEADIVTASGLVNIAYVGFGGVLMRYELLQKVGDTPFAPLPAPNSPWGVTGEDTAFCMRAREIGCKMAIDPRVFLPHLKLGELGPRPNLSHLPLSKSPKMSVQTVCRFDTTDRNALKEHTDTRQDGRDTEYWYPRIFACMRVHNEGRWIRRVLKSLEPLCQRIFILDNCSTDNTLDEIHQVRLDGRVRIDVKSGHPNADEGKDRQELLEVARKAGADWIFNVDGDEELEEDGAEAIRAAITAYRDSYAFAVRIPYLWDRPNQIRVDRWYENVMFPRLFRVTPGLRFSSIKNGIHTRYEGVDGRTLAGVDVNLWHYGYMLKADRIAKWEHYNDIDPNNEAEDCYRHMVIGDMFPSASVFKHAGPLELRQITNGPKWMPEEFAKLTAPEGNGPTIYHGPKWTSEDFAKLNAPEGNGRCQKCGLIDGTRTGIPGVGLTVEVNVATGLCQTCASALSVEDLGRMVADAQVKRAYPDAYDKKGQDLEVALL